MKREVFSRSLLFVCPLLGSFVFSSCGDVDELIDAALSEEHRGRPECPNVCEAVCAGEPEPETPRGCPIPQCLCEPPVYRPECDICVGCPGEPELPSDCPTPPGCYCPLPECPDICGALCAGEPEPETPPGCPIPQCVCD